MESLTLFRLLLLPCCLVVADFRYHFALPPNHPNFKVHPTIHVSTYSTGNVSFVVRTATTTLLRGNVSSSSSASLEVDAGLVVNASDYGNRRNGILVEASDEVVINPIVSVFDKVKGASADTFRVSRSPAGVDPSSATGHDYYIAAADSKGKDLFSYVLLVGQFDYTHVTTSAPTALRVPFDPQDPVSEEVVVEGGETYEFGLNEYETLLIPSKGSDLTGTLVTSTKPLTVLGGHQCANIPVDAMHCDQVVTQIPPVETWGTEFLLSPFEGRMSEQYHRVLAGHADTTLHHNCLGNDTVRHLTSAGDALDLATDYLTSCYLTSDWPVLVVVMSLGNRLDSDKSGGPAISVIAPFGQFASRVAFYGMDATLFPVQFATVKSTAGHFRPRAMTLDSKPLQCDWTIVWNLDGSDVKGYSCKVEIGPGVHAVSHDEGEISVLVYGFHQEQAQGYVYSSNSEWTVVKETGEYGSVVHYV